MTGAAAKKGLHRVKIGVCYGIHNVELICNMAFVVNLSLVVLVQ